MKRPMKRPMKRWCAISAFCMLLPLLAGPALADGGVRVVVPAHDIPRGQTIAESDLTYATVSGSALIAGVVTGFATAKNMEARRLLHAGEPFRADDVRRPIVVNRGQAVTMLFRAPGVELTAMGRAMGEGGIGDTVVVQNPASFRMVNAVISAPGTVIATGSISSIQQTARN
ncbi:MAG: flagellar basal body P-ring formation chaperone FlgA [Rhizomicrobium sp.]